MSHSEGKARLQVQGRQRGLEVTVLNSDFTPVARGVDGLDVELDAGLHEIQFRSGAAEETRLIKLAPGAVHTERAPELSVPSAAPVEGTSTSHEYHQGAAEHASQALAAEGGESGIVVMVRNVRGQDELPFRADELDRLGVLDDRLGEVPGWSGGWVIDEQLKWASHKLSAPPGGYALSLQRAGGTQRVDQAVWLSAGWQSLVFIPNTVDGPAPEQATVHMARMDMGWSPWGEAGDIALALEGALWGLRAGRPVVPRDLGVLLRGKFENPVLGIVAAHALLLAPKPPFETLATVLGNLDDLIPGHPDLIALHYMTESAAARPFRPHGDVAWPPLLLASYGGLIRIDAEHPGVLVTGSQAERLAAQLVVQGLWSAWSHPAETVEQRPGGFRGRSYESFAAPDPAVERLWAYVEGAAAVRGVDAETVLRSPVAKLSRATGLPIGSVARAVHSLLQ